MSTRPGALRQVVLGVLVGTAVTFLTSLAQALMGWLNGDVDSVIGGATAAAICAKNGLTLKQ